MSLISGPSRRAYPRATVFACGDSPRPRNHPHLYRMITTIIYLPDVSESFAPNRNLLRHICHLMARIAFVACLHLRADVTSASTTSSFYQDQIFSTTPPTSFAHSASCRRHSRSKQFPLMLRASSSSSSHRLRWSHRFRAPLPHL